MQVVYYSLANLQAFIFLQYFLVCFYADTRHWGSQSHKCYSIDRIFQVNKASQLGSHISNDSSANTNKGNGDEKAEISVKKSYNSLK